MQILIRWDFHISFNDRMIMNMGGGGGDREDLELQVRCKLLWGHSIPYKHRVLP
jgi:hypothetical protein